MEKEGLSQKGYARPSVHLWEEGEGRGEGRRLLFPEESSSFRPDGHSAHPDKPPEKEKKVEAVAYIGNEGRRT